MKISDLVFVGIAGSVFALNQVTGEKVWSTRLKRTGFVNVVLQNDVILASCLGEIFCLDALTGNGRWHNPLKGFGRGLVTMATESNPAGGARVALAEQHQRDEQAAADAAGAATSC
jgi:outer membrane protein assembly factor BamB